jgi:hypothetical protein
MCCPSSTPTANSAVDHRGSGKSLFDRLTLATIWFEAWTGPPSFWFSNGSRLTTRNRICVAKIPSAMRGRFSSSASQTRRTDETRRFPIAAPTSSTTSENGKRPSDVRREGRFHFRALSLTARRPSVSSAGALSDAPKRASPRTTCLHPRTGPCRSASSWPAHLARPPSASLAA